MPSAGSTSTQRPLDVLSDVVADLPPDAALTWIEGLSGARDDSEATQWY